ncbi:MAG: hypothetical protein ACOCRK_11030 [bacterium]
MKFKLVAILLTFSLTTPFVSGCDWFSSDTGPEELLNKFNNIAEEYYEEDIFTRGPEVDSSTNDYIYQYNVQYNGNLEQKVSSSNDNVFNVFHEDHGIYPIMLDNLHKNFYNNQEMLKLNKSDWDVSKTTQMSNILDDLKEELYNLKEAKISLENVGEIVIEDGEFDKDTAEHLYSEFLEAYNGLIKENIRFAKVFEDGLRDIVPKQDVDTIEEEGVNVRQLEFSIYNAQINLAEGIYNEHILFENGINLDNNSGEIIEKFRSLSENIDSAQQPFSDNPEPSDNQAFPRAYYNLRLREDYIENISSIYKNATKKAKELEDSSSQTNQDMYEYHIQTMENEKENYLNYGSSMINILSMLQ